MPKRIQMSRQRPWRAEHPDAVIVARPSRWGNPYKVTRDVSAERAVELYRVGLDLNPSTKAAIVRDLAGRDLACWCPLDQPCHADVLLELAQGGDR